MRTVALCTILFLTFCCCLFRSSLQKPPGSKVQLNFTTLAQFRSCTDEPLLFSGTTAKSGRTIILVAAENRVSGFLAASAVDDGKAEVDWTYAWQTELDLAEVPSFSSSPAVVDLFGTGENILVTLARSGLQFHTIEDANLSLLAEDGRFDRVHSWMGSGASLIWGQFFPGNKLLGVIARHHNGSVTMYATDLKALKRRARYPLLHFTRNVTWPACFNDLSALIFTVNGVGGEQDMMGCWSAKIPSIEVYRFDKTYKLEGLTPLPSPPRQLSSKVFLASVTNPARNDLLIWGPNSGFRIYVYDVIKSTFASYSNQSVFSSNLGWSSTRFGSPANVHIDADRVGVAVLGPLDLHMFELCNRTMQDALNNSNLKPELIYAKPIGSVSGQLFVHTSECMVYYSNGVDTVGSPHPTELTPPANDTRTHLPNKPVPRVHADVPATDRVTLDNSRIETWLDTWGSPLDSSTLVDGTGNINFQLPLFDQSTQSGLPNVALSLHYSSTNVAVGGLGMQADHDSCLGTASGWRIEMFAEFIAVEYGAFSAIHSWHSILASSIKQVLPSSSTNGSEPGPVTTPNGIFSYRQDDNTWIRETDTEVTSFGIIQWGLNGSHWAGPFLAKKIDQLGQAPYKWFVSERRSKLTGKIFAYKYEAEEREWGTYSLRLVAIKSRTPELLFSVELRYAQKGPGEYTEPPFQKNVSDMLSFPVPLTQNKYLSSVVVESKSGFHITRKVYVLQYDVGDRQKRALIAFQEVLDQQGRSIPTPVLRFAYGTTEELIGIELVEHLNYTISWSPVAVTMTPKVTPVSSLSRNTLGNLIPGPEYLLSTFVAGDVVFLQILEPGGSQLISELRTRPSGPILTYQAQPGGNSSIFVLVYTQAEIHLNIFTIACNGSWNKSPAEYARFSNTSIIRLDSGMAAVYDAGCKPDVVRTYRPTADGVGKSVIMTEQEKPVSMAVGPDMLAIYTGPSLRLYTFEPNTLNYTMRVLANRDCDGHLSKVVSDSISALDRFSISDHLRKRIHRTVVERGLMLHKNLVIVSGIELDLHGRLSANLLLVLLNNERGVGATQSIRVGRERLADIVQPVSQFNHTFFFRYERDRSGMYRLRITRFEGPGSDEINRISDGEQRGVQRTERLKEANEKWEEAAREMTFVAWNQYIVEVVGGGIIQVGNDTTYKPLGSTWELTSDKGEENGGSTPLGRQGLALKFSKDKVRFVIQKGGSAIHSFNVDPPNSLVNAYPLYLAYQAAPTLVALLPFVDGGLAIGVLQIFDGETLHPASNHLNLVTNSSSKTGDRFNIRPVLSLLGTGPMAQQAVDQLSVHTTKKEGEPPYGLSSCGRIVGYSHTLSILNGGKEVRRSTTTTHGAGEFGWSEVTWTWSTKNSSIPTIKTTKAYNTTGGIVQEVKDIIPSKLEAPKESERGDGKHKTQVYDATKRWMIFYRDWYTSGDEMIDYIGFEAYEQAVRPCTGSDPAIWIFDEKTIIRGGWAYTGRSYLHLGQGSARLTRKFTPKEQSATYIFGAWFRTDVIDIAAQFKALITFQSSGEDSRSSSPTELFGILGEVKRTDGDWSYMEILVDLGVAQKMYEAYYYDHKTKEGTKDYPGNHSETFVKFPPAQTNLSITIQVQSGSAKFLHLDHVSFHPQGFSFIARVYEPDSNNGRGLPTAEIHTGGRVSRTHYNRLTGVKVSSWLNSNKKFDQFASVSAWRATVGSRRSSLIIIPEAGTMETFDAYSMRTRWSTTDTGKGWSRAPGQLRHAGDSWGKIMLQTDWMSSDSYAVRFHYTLDEGRTNSPVSAAILKLEFRNLVYQPQIAGGEIIVVVEGGSRYIVFIDGAVVKDEKMKEVKEYHPHLTLVARGSVAIEDMFLFDRPRLELTYNDASGKPIQEIKLESADSVLVHETMHNSMGWPTLTTKPTRIRRSPNQALMEYYHEFVSNRHCGANEPETGFEGLRGLVHDLNPSDGGYPFTSISYEPNPLRRKRIVGMPGRVHSRNGRYALRFESAAGSAWVHNLWPTSAGFRHEQKTHPNGKQQVEVFDKSKLRVAELITGLGYEHALTTFEYNEQGQLTRILPPVFHDRVGTARKRNQYSEQLRVITPELLELRLDLGTEYRYEEGRLVRKSTPDADPTEYMYTHAGHIRFALTMVRSTNGSNATQPSLVQFFYYHPDGQVARTGYLKEPAGKHLLEQYLGTNAEIPESMVQDHQTHLPDESLPNRQGSRRRLHTQSGGAAPVIDDLQFNKEGRLTSKRTTSASHVFELKKNYDGRGRLTELKYPQLNVLHMYNKLGQLVGLGTPSDPLQFASFTYTAGGQVETESHFGQKGESKSDFTRTFAYNSPGWLEDIQDKFLRLSLSYTSGGYGQDGFGEGVVMNAATEALWLRSADARQFRVADDVSEEMVRVHNDSITWTACLAALKRTGQLDTLGRPVHESDYSISVNWLSMPLQCGGRVGDYLKKLMAQKFAASKYGYAFAYGNHGQLSKAKYFSGNSEPQLGPLQSHSFAAVLPDAGSASAGSVVIWDLLKENGYILTQGFGTNSIMTSLGDPFFRLVELRRDLRSLNSAFVLYADNIQNLILQDSLLNNNTITSSNFEAKFLEWSGGVDFPVPEVQVRGRREDAATIFKMLEANKWFTLACLESKFREILKPYVSHNLGTGRIVETLLKAEAQSAGQAAFDYMSFKIDGNGNHEHFYSGSIRYNLSLTRNQVSRVQTSSPSMGQTSFFMEHDQFGSVVKAEHKNISSIRYDPLSRRVMSIEMGDGRALRFSYDGQGERILKEVFDKDGQLMTQTKYLRDENGQTLYDEKTTFRDTGDRIEIAEVLQTSYVYGPRGLLGFLRNGEYHSVLTDHIGSVRLIVKDGRPVAAYDYSPYGELQRCYGCQSPAAQISYRFTGQEYDEETGLYNFHARIYDPELGRFYLVDPRSQYLSPYVYAGNSPASFVDPDGEEAITILMIVCGIIGAYFGAAAANNNWNPAQWDFSKAGTWLGLIGGGIGGALLPYGFVGSVAAIGPTFTVAGGTVGAYGFGALANKNWNPGQWGWDRPGTYNALFQGFSAGSGLPGSIDGLHKFAAAKFGVGTASQKVFLGASYTIGGATAYGGAILANGGKLGFWQWDWTNPATFVGLHTGFSTGLGLATGFTQVGRGVAKNVAKLTDGHRVAKFAAATLAGKVPMSIRSTISSVLSNPSSSFYKVVLANLMAYFKGSVANDDFDITRWNFASFSTYEGLLNGAFMGKDIRVLLRSINSLRVPKAAGSPMQPNFHPWTRIKSWAKFTTGFVMETHKFLTQRAVNSFLVRNVFKSDIATFLSALRTHQAAKAQTPFSSTSEIEKFMRGGSSAMEATGQVPADISRYMEDKVEVPTLDSRHLEEYAASENEVQLDRSPEYLRCKGTALTRRWSCFI